MDRLAEMAASLALASHTQKVITPAGRLSSEILYLIFSMSGYLCPAENFIRKSGHVRPGGDSHKRTSPEGRQSQDKLHELTKILVVTARTEWRTLPGADGWLGLLLPPLLTL